MEALEDAVRIVLEETERAHHEDRCGGTCHICRLRAAVRQLDEERAR